MKLIKAWKLKLKSDLRDKDVIINTMPEDPIDHIDFEKLNHKALSRPLVSHIYTADPSAHCF